MSVYGYLFCRWIWLYLSQEVALVFLLQPVWQYVFLLCATSSFPKINSLFPPLPPPLPPCLSSIFLSLHFMVGSISIPPECLSLSVLCSLSCFSSTWPPWQGAGGLIELCLSVRFGTEAAHLPASTGQLSPFLLGWKDRVLQITFQSERERLRRWGKGCSLSLRSHRHYLFLLLSISHVPCPSHPPSSNFFPDLYSSSSHSQLSLSSCYTATTMAWIWTIELRSRLFSVLLYTQGKLAEHRSDILGSDLNPNLYFLTISQNIVQSNISLIYTLVFHLLSKPSLHCTKNS